MRFYDFLNHFSAISGIIDDIQKHFDIGPSQTSLLRTRIVKFRLIRAVLGQNFWVNYWYQYPMSVQSLDNLSKDQTYQRISLKTMKSRIIIIMIVSPLCGYMGDRYDRKFATLLSIFIWSASNFASTFCVSSQEIIITSKSYNFKKKYCNKTKEFFNVSVDKINQWYWRSVYCLHCSNSFK